MYTQMQLKTRVFQMSMAVPKQASLEAINGVRGNYYNGQRVDYSCISEIIQISVRLTPCGHLFDKETLRTFFKKNGGKSCPLCHVKATWKNVQDDPIFDRFLGLFKNSLKDLNSAKIREARVRESNAVLRAQNNILKHYLQKNTYYSESQPILAEGQVKTELREALHLFLDSNLDKNKLPNIDNLIRSARPTLLLNIFKELIIKYNLDKEHLHKLFDGLLSDLCNLNVDKLDLTKINLLLYLKAKKTSKGLKKLRERLEMVQQQVCSQRRKKSKKNSSSITKIRKKT